jgi:pterin-4a-carbinolamine dehydratase
MSFLDLFEAIVVPAMKEIDVFNSQVDISFHKRLSKVEDLKYNSVEQKLWEHNFQAVKWIDVLLAYENNNKYTGSVDYRQKVLFIAASLHHTCRNLSANQVEEIKGFYHRIGKQLNFDKFLENWNEFLADIAFLSFNSEGHDGNLVGYWGNFHQDKRELMLQTWILSYADVRAFGIRSGQLLRSYERHLAFLGKKHDELSNLSI